MRPRAAGLADETLDYGERMYTRNDIGRRRHETEPEKASVTDQQRARDRHTERDLDVPETLLLESSSLGERLDA